MAHNFDKLKKSMKPRNLRKARAKAKKMMGKLGPLTKKATGVISLKGADYKDVLSKELTKKCRRNT
jgi:hypothetical protein